MTKLSPNRNIAHETLSEISGNVDLFEDPVIGGWVWDAADPTRRLTVEVVSAVDGARLATFKADELREDLAAGIGDGRYGFRVALDEVSDDTEVTVREPTSGVVLGRGMLAGRPSKVSNRVRGSVKFLDQRIIRGWVWDAADPARRLTVEVVSALDGARLAAFKADDLREDLVGAGIGDGRYGFRVALDEVSEDTEVMVREPTSGVVLGRGMLAGRPSKVSNRVRGSVKFLDQRIIRGWVWDAADPALRLTVEVVSAVDGQVLAEVSAEDLREDLVAAGIGDGRYGFRVALDEVSEDTEVTVREPTSGVVLGRGMLAGQPSKVSNRVRGSVKFLDQRTIRGWVWDAADPARRLTVEVVSAVDGQVLTEVSAEDLREDLVAAGIGDGHYAFRATVTTDSDVELQVEIREKSTGLLLGVGTLAADESVISQSPESSAIRKAKLTPFLNSAPANSLIDDEDLRINIFYQYVLSTYKLFDEDFYREMYGHQFGEYKSPIRHYIEVGSKRSFFPNKYFNPREYLELNKYVNKQGIDPIVHYFLFGWNEDRVAGTLFDGYYYCERYPDVSDANYNPLHHFLAFGEKEGRLPLRPKESAGEAKFGDRRSGKIVLVSHDFEVGGAQELIRTFAKWILASTKLQVIFVGMQGGVHAKMFEEIAPIFNVGGHESKVGYEETKKRLTTFIGDDVTCLFINSVASADFFRFWSEPTPAVSYIHELPRVVEQFPGSIETLKARSKMILVGSGAVRQMLLRDYGVAENQIKVVYDFIHNVTPESRGDRGRTAARAFLGIEADTFVVIGCGVMHWRKAPDKFIEVAAQAVQRMQRRCKFVWIGDGPDMGACRELIDRHCLHGQVELVGFQSDLPAVLRAGDLFLLPSEEDPFPLVCLHAAANRMPTICFQEAGGMPEFVERGCGAAVPFGDVDAMTDEVMRYADDPYALQRDGEAAYAELVEGFTVATAGPRILEALRDAAGVKPHVSVVVPNYNYERFLKERLASIYAQTFQDFEVVLLDDASTDDSAAVLEDWAQKRAATRVVINETNSGSPFRQWLKGLEMARADLIWIAEADDACGPNLLETLLPALDDRNVFLAHVKSAPMDAEGRIVGDYDKLYLNRISDDQWSASYAATDHREVNAALAIANVIPNASAVVIRRFEPEPEFVDAVTAMKMCGDWYFYLRALRGGEIAFNAQSLNRHRRHGSTVTRQTEGSLRYFDELAATRAYVNQTYRTSAATREKAAQFVTQDLDRFGVVDPDERDRILRATDLSPSALKSRPSLLVVASDLSPGGGQMFAIRLANGWMRAGGRAVLVNVGRFSSHDQVTSLIDRRVALYDARAEGFSFARLVEEYDIDLVHSSLWWADRFVHENRRHLPDRTPWVVTTHGCYETLLRHPETDESFLQRFPDMLKRVDQWIYTADKNLEAFSKLGRPEHLVKIDSGFEPAPPVRLTREALGLRDDALVLLLASRAIEEKGWLEAVEAVAWLNRAGMPVDLMLVGEGPVGDRLRAGGLPPYVRLYGQVANLQDYIAACDVGLLPSYFLGESMPLVLIEMLAQGKPVVASDAGEIADMLTLHGQTAGVVVPLKHNRIFIEDLVEALHSLRSEATRAEKGRVAVEIFKARFTMNAMLGAYDDLYRRHIDWRQAASTIAESSGVPEETDPVVEWAPGGGQGRT